LRVEANQIEPGTAVGMKRPHSLCPCVQLRLLHGPMDTALRLARALVPGCTTTLGPSKSCQEMVARRHTGHCTQKGVHSAAAAVAAAVARLEILGTLAAAEDPISVDYCWKSQSRESLMYGLGALLRWRKPRVQAG